MMSPLTLGTSVLIGAIDRRFIPSVREYPILDARDFDLDLSAVEVDQIIGEVLGEVLGHGGHVGLWPRGNVVWPGVELEEELSHLPAWAEYGIGAGVDVLVGLTVVPPGPRLWTGSTEDLLSRIDWDRTFDEGFDEATIRNTNRMRGGG